MMCYYLNVQFQGQRVNNTFIATFRYHAVMRKSLLKIMMRLNASTILQNLLNTSHTSNSGNGKYLTSIFLVNLLPVTSLLIYI